MLLWGETAQGHIRAVVTVGPHQRPESLRHALRSFVFAATNFGHSGLGLGQLRLFPDSAWSLVKPFADAPPRYVAGTDWQCCFGGFDNFAVYPCVVWSL
jgi:hypothetical protein